MASELVDSYLLVAAIDFGTTYSGYAFSFKTTPLDIMLNQTWNSGRKQLFSQKTPTCLLLNNKKEFVSFGYEAENKYAEIALEDKHGDYFFFHRFKMSLHTNKNIKEDVLLEDLTGKSLPAIVVFSLAIGALKSNLISRLKTIGLDIRESDIRWVLTVPAIWGETAKQFMRKCATMAGISDTRLLIALEPEAASICCQYLPCQNVHAVEKGLTKTVFAKKYLVADIGGGTADITVHETTCFDTIKQVCKSTGNACGGTSVDSAYYQMLVKIFGGPFLTEFKQNDPSSYLDLFQEFEMLKRTLTVTQKERVIITWPCVALDDFCKQHHDEDLKTVMKNSPFAESIIIRKDKLLVDVDVIKDLFKPTIDCIVTLIRRMLLDTGSQDKMDLLLVGGFSESALLQYEIQKSFPKHRVIVPDDAGLAVLKGAVLFGHFPEKITSRILRVTFGAQSIVDFDALIHDPKRLIEQDGIAKCIVFNTIATQDTEMKSNTTIKHTYKTYFDFQRGIQIDLYVSEKKNPKYTDEDGCTHIGNCMVTIPNPSEERRVVDVLYCFGNTELKITAKDRKSGKVCKSSISFI